MFFALAYCLGAVCVFDGLKEERQKVSKHEYAWYYVRASLGMNLSDLRKIAHFSDHNTLPIDERSASIYMHREDASKLKESLVFVKKIPSQAKFHGESSRYLIYHTKDCVVPVKTTKMSSMFSVSEEGADKWLISKTKCVRSFEPFTNSVRMLTRENRQLTHYLYPPFQRSLVSRYPGIDTVHSLGFNGKGQCAALVDTGLDIFTPWFSDPNGNAVINSTLVSHRKVKSILPFGDFQDDRDGHGTFLAGIIAGKPRCPNFSPSYNGIASEAKVFVVDLKRQNESSYVFPKDLADIVEVPSFFDCKIQLNAWTTQGSPLLTQAVDTIAYNNPSVLMIFPAESDSDDRIKSPADAKNVLTVGEVTGIANSTVRSLILSPLTGHNSNFIGYEDPQGTPILFGVQESVYTIGNCSGCVHIVEDEDLISANASMLLVFGEYEMKKRYDVPVIRCHEEASLHLTNETKVLITPSFYPSDDKHRPYRQVTDPNLTTTRVLKIKPEIVAPGGPLLGAKAGSRRCDDELLTEKSGVSISAAVVAGDALIIRQYLVESVGIKSPSGQLIKAALIHSAQDINGNTGSSRGWGVPFLENILPLGTVAGVQYSVHFSNDVNISSSTYHSYCFNVTSEGIVRATLSWSDLPRDPYSLVDVASPISLRIIVDDQTSSAALANNLDTDMPTIDVFNTVLKAEKRVSVGQRVKVLVVANNFSLDIPTSYSMVLSAPTPASHFNNMTCESDSGPSCGRDCVFRGSCVNGFCKCVNDRAGDFCGTKVEKISGGNAWRGSLRRFEWVILKYIPKGWSPGSKIKIPLSSIRKSQFGLRITVGSPPSWSQALCTDQYCVGGVFEDDYLYLPYQNWEFIGPKSPLMVGIFSTNHEASSLDFVLNVEKE